MVLVSAGRGSQARYDLARRGEDPHEVVRSSVEHLGRGNRSRLREQTEDRHFGRCSQDTYQGRPARDVPSACGVHFVCDVQIDEDRIGPLREELPDEVQAVDRGKHVKPRVGQCSEQSSLTLFPVRDQDLHHSLVSLHDRGRAEPYVSAHRISVTVQAN
jgi:hypothetical protein